MEHQQRGNNASTRLLMGTGNEIIERLLFYLNDGNVRNQVPRRWRKAHDIVLDIARTITTEYSDSLYVPDRGPTSRIEGHLFSNAMSRISRTMAVTPKRTMALIYGAPTISCHNADGVQYPVRLTATETELKLQIAAVTVNIFQYVNGLYDMLSGITHHVTTFEDTVFCAGRFYVTDHGELLMGGSGFDPHPLWMTVNEDGVAVAANMHYCGWLNHPITTAALITILFSSLVFELSVREPPRVLEWLQVIYV